MLLTTPPTESVSGSIHSLRAPVSITPKQGLAKPQTQRGVTRILLVEDNRDTAAFLHTLLERKGYEVHTAHHVLPAIEIANAVDPDLLVSNILLPDGSGLELMSYLRKTRSIRGVALGRDPGSDDFSRSRKAGFGRYLVKPINVLDLYAAISYLIVAGTRPATEIDYRQVRSVNFSNQVHALTLSSYPLCQEQGSWRV